MKLILLIFLIISSQYAVAEHYEKTDTKAIGGWINYTAITGDYILDSHPDLGIFGTKVLDHNFSLSGMVLYDPLYKKGRVAYAYISHTPVLFDIPVTLEAGMLRSEWGFWGDAMITPGTAPVMFSGNAIYTARYNSDTLNRPGIALKFRTGDVSTRVFVGANYAIDDDEYIRRNYIQKDADINTKFGSIYSMGMTWMPDIQHSFNFDYIGGNISEDADVDRNAVMIGYKYENNNWIASLEYVYLEATADVNFPNHTWNAGTGIWNDVFAFVAYDFDKTRVYGSYSYSKKNDAMAEYVGASSVSNMMKGLSPVSTDPLPRELISSGNHNSQMLNLGIIYDIQSDLQLRVEGAYMHSEGLERLIGNKKDAIKDENETFFGISITKKF